MLEITQQKFKNSMTRIGIYTATENELGSIGQAADRLDDIELVVRSESDLDDEAAVRRSSMS